MAERSDVSSKAVPSSDDLKKKSARGRGVVAEPVRFGAQLAADTYGGIAAAVAEAFRAFSGEVEEANVARRGLLNSVVDGLLAGNTKFFENVANTSRNVAQGVKSWEAPEPRPAPEAIDYAQLARLVADELSRRKAAG